MEGEKDSAGEPSAVASAVPVADAAVDDGDEGEEIVLVSSATDSEALEGTGDPKHDGLSTGSATTEGGASKSGDNDADETAEAKISDGACEAVVAEDVVAASSSSSLLDQAEGGGGVSAEDEAIAEAERLRMMEEMHIGTATEILFPNNETSAWDNLRWMSLSGVRKATFSRIVFRRVKEQSTIIGLWKSQIRVTFPSRLLVLYQCPEALLLILRRATDMTELSQYTGLEYTEEELKDAEKILLHYWIAETAVDLSMSQLQLSALTTHGTSEVISKVKHPREGSCFQLMTPSQQLESLCLSAVQQRSNNSNNRPEEEMSLFMDSGAFMETTSTETALVQAICQAQQHGDSGGEDLTWKHQIILGTLHAHVLSGNSQALEQALDRAWRQLNKSGSSETADESTNGKPRVLPGRIIDATDDSGFTPLYYACQQSMNDAIALLLRYGASLEFGSNIRNDDENTTTLDSLLHICARARNDKGLMMLLSPSNRSRNASSSFHLDPNALNSLGRTPLWTSVVDPVIHNRGAAQDNDSSAQALNRCIQLLGVHGGTLFASGSGEQQHPLLTLTLQNRAKDLAVLMDYLPLDFPFQSRRLDVLKSAKGTDPIGEKAEALGESLASLYGYPVHCLLAGFHQQIRLGKADDLVSNKNKGADIVETLRLLLQGGFEANERVEGGLVAEKTEGSDGLLGAFVGFTPLQILTVVALELENSATNTEAPLPESTYGALDAIVSQLCEHLITNGARLLIELPPLERKRQKSASPRKQSSASLEESDGDDDARNSFCQALDNANSKNSVQMIHLLGGESKIRAAQSWFSGLGSVNNSHGSLPLNICDDASAPIPDSDACGGSSERSCAICWKQFGTLVNRKHRCRISWRHVCDDCSTKRILVGTKECRVSDGQFARARAVSIKQETQRHAREASKSGDRSARAPAAAASARLQRLEAEEKANRDSLFGGDMMEQATNFLFGAEEETTPAGQANGLMNSLGETRNALIERGDKLSSLNEKSAQMVSASEDFAKLATELRKKSERGLFW